MPLTSLRSLSGRASGQTARAEDLAPNSYVTDGRRLFRVVSQFTGEKRRRFASLEDCLTLKVEAYSPGELAMMRLELVVAGGSHRQAPQG